MGHLGNERADETAKTGTLDVSLKKGDISALALKIVKNNLKAGFLKAKGEMAKQN